MTNFKRSLCSLKRKAFAASVAVGTALPLAVSSFAVDPAADTGVIDPTLFDPLVSGITGNISAVLPKILVVVALLIGISVVIGMFKKNSRPS